MKKIISIFAVAAFLFSANAKAQLVNDTEGYQRIEASFAVQKFITENDNHSEEDKTKGFELGFIKGISLTNRIPLFLELGGQLTWTHSKDEVDNVDNKVTFMNIAIPVNVAYKFAFANSENITIVPFVGPNFKFNVIGKEKWGDEKVSYLSKDDMGGKDNRANIFQVGLNLGVGVNIAQRLYVGYRFQPDFTKYIEIGSIENKTRTNYLTLGINF